MTLIGARTVKPGQIIDRELTARGWSQKDLAEIIGRPVQAINEIIGGIKQITPNTAHELAQAFGTSAEFWMNLEANYRLYLAQKEQGTSEIQRRSKLYSIAPVKELVKRGWIKSPESIDELEKAICSFLEIPSTDEQPKFEVAVSRRHSVDRGPIEISQIAVLKRAQHLAKTQKVPKFDLKKFREQIPRLLDFSENLEDIANIRKALMELGVRFVIVPPLPQSFLDGAAFKPDGNPVLLLTLRYDRIDNFWFNLMHEIAHISAGHRGVFIDNDIEQEGQSDEERDADSNAKNWLIDATEYRSFVNATRPYFSKNKIISFAQKIKRHPGIVLGRLRREKEVSYSHLRLMLDKVKPQCGSIKVIFR